MDNIKKTELTAAAICRKYGDLSHSTDIIALPAPFGVKFYDKNEILLFRSVSSHSLKRPYWEAFMIDHTLIKLRNRVTAEKIIKRLSQDSFFQISQSYIINRAYLGGIRFKTNVCTLVEPFDKIELIISRDQLIKMREIFEIL